MQDKNMKINEIRLIIRECIREIIEQDVEYVTAVRGQDYATINGMAYQLKECGVDSKLNYKNGAHRLLVRRDHLPRAIEMLENSVDEVSSVLAERLKKKYQSE